MLCLSRRVDQSIHIGNDIVVKVLEIRGDRVQLGIAAPREVKVHRDEVIAALARQEAVERPVKAGS